jgi:hypothetical protein
MRSRLIAFLLMVVASPSLIFLGAPSPAQAEGRAHVVAFGLDGKNELFRSEAMTAADWFYRHTGGRGLKMVGANRASRVPLDLASMTATMQAVGSAADPEDDILILFLTSHGSSAGLAVDGYALAKPQLIGRAGIEAMLSAAQIKHRVVVLSACYSGAMIPAAPDPQTLYVTASDATHPSFGCSTSNPKGLTYFGEAMFDRGLRGKTFEAHFRAVRAAIARRERAEGLEHSNPQIAGGAATLRRLDALLRAPEGKR